MCVYIYIYIYNEYCYIYIYIYTYTYITHTIYIYIYMYMCVYIYIYIYRLAFMGPRAELLGLELTSLPVLWKPSLLMRVMGARRPWAWKCLSPGERSGQSGSLFRLAMSLPVWNPLPRPPCPWPPWKSGRMRAPRSDLAVGEYISLDRVSLIVTLCLLLLLVI